MGTTTRSGLLEPLGLPDKTASHPPPDRLVLQAPPPLPEHEATGSGLVHALPVLGSLGSIVLVAGLGGAGGTGRGYLAAGMFLLATVGTAVLHADRQRAQRARKVSGSRTAYLRYLAGVRQVVREAADRQRRTRTWTHPSPEALPSLAADRSRVWQRGPSDPAYLEVRYGLSAQPLAIELVAPEATSVDEADPVAGSALRRLLAAHRLLPDLPASVDVRAFERIEVCGADQESRALARAMVCNAAAFHSPACLGIAVLAAEQNLVHWDWVKWLPHARSTARADAVGARRMVSTSHDDLAAMAPASTGARHLLLVVDGVTPPSGSRGVTVVHLAGLRRELDDESCLRLLFGSEETRPPRYPLTVLRRGAAPVQAFGDRCDLATAEAFARRLAPLSTEPHGVTARADGQSSASPGVLDLLGLGEINAFEPRLAWRRQAASDRLRVPIGVGDDGGIVHLDLKESAQGGMGPHGLLVGATGSGKSELLRTLVLGLAMTHSPQSLNMVLVDFKGGASFAGMADLPHVSAVITNLAQELTLVDRMQDALSGELVRRQELLRDAGNYASLHDYEKARAAGERLEPIPSLFIVVDEFSEMLSAKPEFIDLFVTIGRLGRSLGLHLLLASQRLDEGRLRGLESHLSFRVALRTFTAAESRGVLGVADAYELPPVPGLGFLRPDQSTRLRFRAAYVSGPPPTTTAPRLEEGRAGQGILPFTISEVRLAAAAPTAAGSSRLVERPADPSSLLDVAVARMTGHGGPVARQIWLPPLDEPDPLGPLLGELVEDPVLGLVSPRWRRPDHPVIPIGIVDRPREQRRDTLTVDLTGAAGHVVVVGGPRSGKSTLLRTLVTSLVLTTTPKETQVYAMDLGGGALAPLDRLPHVAGVVGRSEPDVVRRMVAEVTGVFELRETYFRDEGIDSIETYRTRRAEGRADDGYGDVYLVVDGWSALRADFDDVELDLQQLAGRGLTFGFHLLVSTSRWADLRAAMRDVLGTRLELRLGDPLDSEIDRRSAALVPAGRPGRGLVTSKQHFLAALPRIDGSPGTDDLADGLDDLVQRVTSAWHGPPGPRLRLLPEVVDLESLVGDVAPGNTSLVLGVDEKDLAPVQLDPDRQPHLLVFGDGQSGKSTTLRAYVREVVRTRTPQQAQLVVVDYRRALLGEVPEDYLLDYLTSAAQATPVIRDLAAYLESRMPGPEVTSDQLRTRSWWTGAEVYVVVDDYDLVSTQESSPVAPLKPLLAQSRDVGLHLVVARRSGGAARASYEPVLQSLRELAMPGLVLSGSPDEGVLVGNVRPQPLPPGRGRLWTRERGTETVQVAWTDPAL